MKTLGHFDYFLFVCYVCVDGIFAI